MQDRPAVIVFDVNETLSDMSPMATHFAEIGASPELAGIWFAGILRDGFALAAAGGSEQFMEIATGSLHGLLQDRPLNRSVDTAVEHVMAAFSTLSLHPDAAGGIADLKAAGFRLAALTNGSIRTTERLLDTAGVVNDFERLLSVADAPAWKPHRAAYAYAAETLGVDAAQMLLTAVHPWDIHGAAVAGLRTAWVDRTGVPYPDYFTAPGVTIKALDELAAVLTAS